jgi:hypothetical protein
METLTLTSPITLKASSPKKFTMCAYSGGFMFPEMGLKYNGPVVVDIAGMEYTLPLPAHLDHDTATPVGHVDTLDASSGELLASGVFSIEDGNTQKLIKSSQNGFPWKASVGLKINEYKTIDEGQKLTVNGREFVGPFLLVTSSSLKEISFVTVPGDDETSAKVLAKFGGGTMPTFEEWVTSLGLDPANLSEDLKSILTEQYQDKAEDSVASTESEKPEEVMQAEGEVMPEEKKDEAVASGAIDLTAQRKEIAREQGRMSAISKLCASAGYPTIVVGKAETDLAAHAIEQGWTADKTELHIHRLNQLKAHRDARPYGPAIHSTSKDSRTTLAALQGALLLRAGKDLDSKIFSDRRLNQEVPEFLKANINDPVRQRAMDAAWEFRDNSLVDLCAKALALDPSINSVPRGRLDMVRAAFSSNTVQNLFGSTFSAQVISSYAEIRDFTQGWTSESENIDMESHNRLRLVAASNLEYLPINGEAAHASRDLKTEATRVERFARQLEIDEADIMGDRFNQLSDTPRMFGLAAARVRPDLAANILLANANLSQTSRALFNSTDGNALTATPLARAGLQTAIATMAKFKDGDATINLAASHLVCPPDIFDTANQLTQSPINATTTAEAGVMNPIYSYGIIPVGEARLANGVIDPVAKTSRSGSTSTWYLASKEANTIDFVYLSAAGRAPMVRTSQLVNGKFGLNFDVRLYIGAKALDWRGMIRCVAS